MEMGIDEPCTLSKTTREAAVVRKGPPQRTKSFPKMASLGLFSHLSLAQLCLLRTLRLEVHKSKALTKEGYSAVKLVPMTLFWRVRTPRKVIYRRTTNYLATTTSKSTCGRCSTCSKNARLAPLQTKTLQLRDLQASLQQLRVV